MLHERVLNIVSKASRQRVQSGGKEKGMKRKRGCVGDEGRGPASARQRSLSPWQPTSPCVWEGETLHSSLPFCEAHGAAKLWALTLLYLQALCPHQLSHRDVSVGARGLLCLEEHCRGGSTNKRDHHFRETRQKIREI